MNAIVNALKDHPIGGRLRCPPVMAQTVALLCVLAGGPGCIAQTGETGQAWRPPALDPNTAREVVEGNIFLADRTRAVYVAPTPDHALGTDVSTPPSPAPPPETPDTDARLVLVGVAIRDGRACAFIVDRAAGTIDRVEQTGPLGRGEVVGIDIDGMSYRVDGETRRIPLTYSLAGTRPSIATTAAPGITTADSAAGASVGPSDPRLAGLLERMRLRRLQESGAGQPVPESPSSDQPAPPPAAGETVPPAPTVQPAADPFDQPAPDEPAPVEPDLDELTADEANTP